MFDWDCINTLLWPLGNYLEYKRKRVAWAVELNGTITEFEAGTCEIRSFFFILTFYNYCFFHQIKIYHCKTITNEAIDLVMYTTEYIS